MKMMNSIALRLYQYKTLKLFKTMKILMKRLKARNLCSNEKSMKKLMKLRKWMDMLGPAVFI